MNSSNFFLPLITTALIFGSCNDTVTEETRQEEVSFFSKELNKEIKGFQLKNYFLSNQVIVNENYLVEVLQDQAKFDSFLHPAAVAGVHFREIDFDKEFVVMVAGKPSNNRVDLSISEGIIQDKNLQLQLREMVSIDTDNFLTTSLLAYSFPKEDISKIIVIINGNATEKTVN